MLLFGVGGERGGRGGTGGVCQDVLRSSHEDSWRSGAALRARCGVDALYSPRSHHSYRNARFYMTTCVVAITWTSLFIFVVFWTQGFWFHIHCWRRKHARSRSKLRKKDWRSRCPAFHVFSNFTPDNHL